MARRTKWNLIIIWEEIKTTVSSDERIAYLHLFALFLFRQHVLLFAVDSAASPISRRHTVWFKPVLDPCTEGARNHYLLLSGRLMVGGLKCWSADAAPSWCHFLQAQWEEKWSLGTCCSGLTSFHGAQLNQNRDPIPRHQRLYFLIAPAPSGNMNKPDWPRPPSNLWVHIYTPAPLFLGCFSTQDWTGYQGS